MDWCWDLIRKCMWIFGNVLSGKRSAMRRKRSNVYTSVVYHETLIIFEGPKRSSCIVLLCLFFAYDFPSDCIYRPSSMDFRHSLDSWIIAASISMLTHITLRHLAWQ